MRARFLIHFRLYVALALCVGAWVTYVFFTKADPRWKLLLSVPVFASTIALFVGPITAIAWIALSQLILAGVLFYLVGRED